MTNKLGKSGTEVKPRFLDGENRMSVFFEGASTQGRQRISHDDVNRALETPLGGAVERAAESRFCYSLSASPLGWP